MCSVAVCSVCHEPMGSLVPAGALEDIQWAIARLPAGSLIELPPGPLPLVHAARV